MRFDAPTGRVGTASWPTNHAAASSLVSCQAEADGDLSPWARSAGCGGGNLEGGPVRQVGQQALAVDGKVVLLKTLLIDSPLRVYRDWLGLVDLEVSRGCCCDLFFIF